ncbi:MAG: hypothetical protein QCI38_05310, partial [Candidatus Thermoplasmatota archaeon]|nr:hypothetical protein [Candidatus Thermoplasmatota archaeon]
HGRQVVARLDGHSHSAPLVRTVHLWNPEEAMEFTSHGLLSRDAAIGGFIEVRSGSRIVLEAREICVDGTMVLAHFLYHSPGP